MRKKIVLKGLCILSLLLFTACSHGEPAGHYEKHSDSFFDTFETVTLVVGYTASEAEFASYVTRIHDWFMELHQLYDIYNDYEGINNIKTINDNAGIQPVKVDKAIIDLILFAKEWYPKSEGKMNIAMGSVLKIWHEYREAGSVDPSRAGLPPLEELREAAAHTDINKVIVDVENSTVYLDDAKMSLDVGGVAKGFAVELVAREIMAEGFTSGLINAGGNVRVLGKPLDGLRERWAVGIQLPDELFPAQGQGILDTAYVNQTSVVTSGDYQRYYVVDGKRYHHIIDPDTLMPGSYYRGVTVLTEDSGAADFLTKGFFLLPYEHSRALAESMEGVDVLWVMPDGTIEATDGMKRILKSYGASEGNNP